MKQISLFGEEEIPPTPPPQIRARKERALLNVYVCVLRLVRVMLSLQIDLA